MRSKANLYGQRTKDRNKLCLPSRRVNGHGRRDGGHMISLVAGAMDLDSVGRMWPFGNNLFTPESVVWWIVNPWWL